MMKKDKWSIKNDVGMDLTHFVFWSGRSIRDSEGDMDCDR